MDPQWYQIGYLISATFFIFGLKMLGHPRTAPRGNQMGAIGMLWKMAVDKAVEMLLKLITGLPIDVLSEGD